jgi:formiminotetrahydrofolate cyclodeaminase
MGGRLASSDLDLPLSRFLDAVAREEPAPGGGSVSAVVGALGAALVEMAARFSHDWAGGPGAAARARQLRDRLTALAPQDAAAYEALLAARREGGDARGELSDAAAVPLEIAEAAVDVVVLGALVAGSGNANLRSDARAGALFAEAAARAAANLVEVNLEDAADPRVRRARELADTAARGTAEGHLADVH